MAFRHWLRPGQLRASARATREIPLAASIRPIARISVSRENRENALDATQSPSRDAGKRP